MTAPQWFGDGLAYKAYPAWHIAHARQAAPKRLKSLSRWEVE